MTRLLIVAEVRKEEEFRDLLRGRGIEVFETCSVEAAPAQVAALRPDAIFMELATARPPNVFDRIRELHPGGTIRLLGRGIEAGNLASALEDILDGSTFHGAFSTSEKNGQLTPRELQVARQVEKGRTNQEIADFLGISECTVKSHVHAILQKLQIKHRGQIASLLDLLKDD